MSARRTVSALIEKGRFFAPEYGGGLSNHLPMALTALNRLGASDEVLNAFFASYSSRLEATEAPEPAQHFDRFQIQDHLGRREDYRVLLSYFTHELATKTSAEVLRQHLPILSEGIAAAAFHGLIRTAYGLSLGEPSELAAGLAYWAACHLVIPHRLRAGRLSVSEWAPPILEHFAGRSFSDGLIFARVAEAGAEAEFGRLVDGLAVDGTTLEHLARFAAEDYLKSRDFTVLHLVTSAHAVRVIVEHGGDCDALMPNYALAYGATWASTASAPRDQLMPPVRTWEEIRTKAMSSTNDHVIKLVDTCVQQARHYGGDLWRQVASAAVR